MFLCWRRGVALVSLQGLEGALLRFALQRGYQERAPALSATVFVGHTAGIGYVESALLLSVGYSPRPQLFGAFTYGTESIAFLLGQGHKGRCHRRILRGRREIGRRVVDKTACASFGGESPGTDL